MRLKRNLLCLLAIFMLLHIPLNVNAMNEHALLQETKLVNSVPKGYVFVSVYDRKPKTMTVRRAFISDTSVLELYLPNNNGRDRIQGEVRIRSGNKIEKTYKFVNSPGEFKTFRLRDIPKGTMYTIEIYGYAFGESGKANVYYRFE